MKEVIQTEWRGWWLHQLAKTKTMQHKQVTMLLKKTKHQGDAMQPTHIYKNKQLEWVKKQRKQKDAMLPLPWNNKKRTIIMMIIVLIQSNNGNRHCFHLHEKKCRMMMMIIMLMCKNKNKAKKSKWCNTFLQTTMTHVNKQKTSKSWKNTKRI
jgi:hypothetical protein